jgi:hypothetical protein
MTQRMLATSPGGRWTIARDGRELLLFGQDRRRRFELDCDDVDLMFVSPDSLIEIARDGGRTRVHLREMPMLETVARLELDLPVWLRAMTGPRLALVAADNQHVAIVRVAPRALGQQALDVGVPFEFVVGLERDQLLFALPKELKVWDAVSGRPLLKLALPLPPAPRNVGTAAGHLWAVRKGGEDVFVYRLSDGRPFQHRIGAKIEEVIAHPSSPILVLATPRGLVRLHCLAHTVTAIEHAPWAPPEPGKPPMPLAQLAVGDEIRVLGMPDGAKQPWAMTITGTSARAADMAPFVEDSAAPAAEAKPREPAPDAVTTPVIVPPAPRKTWRDRLAVYGEHLVHGGARSELGVIEEASELGVLAERLLLTEHARRALAALYALYLVGEPAVAIARISQALENWAEPLGQGELAALAMLRRRDGTVALRKPVTDLLDGAPPSSIRIAGGEPTTPRAGAFRVARDGRPDAEIEADLVAKLGRIAMVTGPLSRALLEARVHGATAVTLAPPGERPTPWPKGAGLVLVLYGTASAWVADVPALGSA